MRSRTTLVTLSFALLVSPAMLRAQNLAAPAMDGPSVVVAPTLEQRTTDTQVQSNRADSTRSGIAGAPMNGLRAGAHRLSSTTNRTVAAERHSLGQPAAMMVVGLAGLVAGAIIGGDPGTIIMVGGAVVGLIGLWEYLQ